MATLVMGRRRARKGALATLATELGSAWALLKTDAARYTMQFEGDAKTSGVGSGSFLGALLLNEGLRVSAVYRFGRALRQVREQVDGPMAQRMLLALAAVHLLVEKANIATTGMVLETNAEVGPGLYLAHFGALWVGGGVVIGTNCNIGHAVTLGRGGPGQTGSAILGDRVWVGPGVVVNGPIHLGDDSAVGANSVVTKDVPARVVVAGVPAKVVSEAGSFGLVEYPGMQTDPVRAASLAAAGPAARRADELAADARQSTAVTRGESRR